MDLKSLRQVVEKIPLTAEKKIITGSKLGQIDGDGSDVRRSKNDSSNALQAFLDHIPINSIPGVENPPGTIVELKPDDTVRTSIALLYEKNISGAPIVDEPKSGFGRSDDREIGFIDFSTLILWCLGELEKRSRNADWKRRSNGFLSALEQISDIGDTKVAVLRLLLESRGLDWFDEIADKKLSEFKFINIATAPVYVYSEQSLEEALQILWEKQLDEVPVIDQRTGKLTGSITCGNLHLLLDHDEFFNDRKRITVSEFIKQSDARTGHRTSPVLVSASVLSLKNESRPLMGSVATNRKSDTLKQVMENLASCNGELSFLVDEEGQVEGVVRLVDVIKQFSPPSMESKIDGGGFFMSALEQAGCHLEDGSITRN